MIQRLVDPLVTSASYSSDSVQNWLVDMSNSEYFWNAITVTIAPQLYQAGSDSISKVSSQTWQSRKSVSVSQWPSIFSGLEVISNRMTLSHRDPGGAPSHYDMLVSLGIEHDTIFSIEDLEAELVYSPGTMTYIAGRVRAYYFFTYNSSPS